MKQVLPNNWPECQEHYQSKSYYDFTMHNKMLQEDPAFTCKKVCHFLGCKVHEALSFDFKEIDYEFVEEEELQPDESPGKNGGKT